MTKEERRAAMPQTSAWIDDIREHFGDPVFIHAVEAGHEITWGNDVTGLAEER